MRLTTHTLLAALLLTGCNISFSPGSSGNVPEPTAGSPAQQAEAEQAARGYLAMIDRDEIDKTWDQAGSALRAQSSKLAWTSVIGLTRKTLGVSAEREVEGFGFSSQIDPSVPVGVYVLVQFKSVSGRTTATEKVVMQKEQSAWKIIGYFVTKRAEYKLGT
jgi:hypothetical protein